jgi:hephaestin
MGNAIRALAGGVVAVLVTGCGAAKDAAAPVAARASAPATDSASGSARTSQVDATRAPEGGKERRYYIAAEEVLWDYAPSGRDQVRGAPFDEGARVFTAAAADRIGSTYTKCLYRGYTDATFATPQARPEAERYLGFLGPTIRAEVGDTVEVVFRNRCSFPTSVHPHGVRYDKANEGAGYSDGTDDRADDEVATGAEHTYHWEVPERAGPGPMDGSSAMWMYHSHSDEIADVYAGLSGFLVVTAKGKARADGSPADVDREVFSLFEVVDENSSALLDANVARAAAAATDLDDEGFVESNLMHAINGYVFGNGPTVTMRRGDRVRWYLMGMGTEVDLHTPHWHGNTAVVNGMRTDVANLLPASMAVADLTPDAAGTWLFHCHVADHIAAGMVTRYEVTD